VLGRLLGEGAGILDCPLRGDAPKAGERRLGKGERWAPDATGTGILLPESQLPMEHSLPALLGGRLLARLGGRLFGRLPGRLVLVRLGGLLLVLVLPTLDGSPPKMFLTSASGLALER